MPASAHYDAWFNQWLKATGPNLINVVQTVIKQVEAYEAENERRQRNRKKADQEKFEQALEIIVTNLVHTVLMLPPPGHLAILTGNGKQGMTRYDNPVLGKKPLRSLLFVLWELELLVWHPSSRLREASSITPSEIFRQSVSDMELSMSDIGRYDRREVLVLARSIYHRQPSGERKRERTAIDYRETAETVRLRAQVRAINSFLSDADIAFVEDGLDKVDTANRHMERIFVLFDEEQPETFQYGGRLFGGFWQNLAKERREGIRIDGEPVAILDYSSMAPRLAYAGVGEQPPDGDLYAIPGLEQHRKAVKKAFSCFLSDNWKRRKWPDELTNHGNEDDNEALIPASWTPHRLRNALIKLHPALKDSFGHGLSFTLMFMESNILIHVLEELRARNIVALGLHDGIMVARSKVEEAKVAMKQAALDIAGINIPVGIDDGGISPQTLANKSSIS